MARFARILSLIFVGMSLMEEHFYHNVPQATLMIGWAIFAYLSVKDAR